MPIKKTNVNRLKALISPKSPTKAQQEAVVRDYEQRKIANYLTAENLILKLQSSNKKLVEKTLRDVIKYEDAEPITGRLKKQVEDPTKRRISQKMSYEEVKFKRLNEEEENKKVKVRVTRKMKESANKIKNAFRTFLKPKVTYKSIDKVMSTVEIDVDHLKKENKDIISFMGSIKNKLIESARKLITVKTNVKLGLGVNATFVKVADNKEEADSGINNTISTKHASVHSKAQVARVVDSLIEDLLFMFENTKHKGSGYSVKKIHRVFLKSYTVKPVRGSSYIPTPEKFAHSKCGLVNINNEDNECFKWCMKYHQTKKDKNDDRVSVLKRLMTSIAMKT